MCTSSLANCLVCYPSLLQVLTLRTSLAAARKTELDSTRSACSVTLENYQETLARWLRKEAAAAQHPSSVPRLSHLAAVLLSKDVAHLDVRNDVLQQRRPQICAREAIHPETD